MILHTPSSTENLCNRRNDVIRNYEMFSSGICGGFVLLKVHTPHRLSGPFRYKNVRTRVSTPQVPTTKDRMLLLLDIIT